MVHVVKITFHSAVTKQELAVEMAKPKPSKKVIARLKRSVEKMDKGGVFYGTSKEEVSGNSVWLLGDRL